MSGPIIGEATARATVTVVFLRMLARPSRPVTLLPPGVCVRQERVSLEAYRKLYDGVGGPYLWWLRRLMPDKALAQHLASPTVAVHLLRVEGEVAGFFELDSSPWPFVNLNYFGLLPSFIGKGLGRLFLDCAVDATFAGESPLRGMSVNTCDADHPRALPNYLAAGFVEYRRVREVWDIPVRLGFDIPDRLKG